MRRLQGVRQLLPGPGAAVVVGDRPQRLDVARIDLQHLLPALERVALARQLLAPDAAEPLVRAGSSPRARAARNWLSRTSVSSRHSPGLLVQIGQRRQRDRVVAAQVERPCRHSSTALLAIVEHVGGDAWPSARSSRPAPRRPGRCRSSSRRRRRAPPSARCGNRGAPGRPSASRRARSPAPARPGSWRSRRLGIVEHVGQHAAKPQVQPHQLLRVVGDGDALAQNLRQLLEHPLRYRRCDRGSQRRRILRLLAEDLDAAPPRPAPDRRDRSRRPRPAAAARRAGPAGSRADDAGLGHRVDVRVPLVRDARQAQQLVQRLLARTGSPAPPAPTTRRPRPDRRACARQISARRRSRFCRSSVSVRRPSSSW